MQKIEGKKGMTIFEAIDSINAGGFLAVIIILLSLVEIVPVKFSPLAWIGRRLNKETLDKVVKVESKLDEHIAGSYRSAIFKFCDDVQAGTPKSKEQWKEMVNAIYSYEKYCEKNKIQNGLCREASQYLLSTYQSKLQHNEF